MKPLRTALTLCSSSYTKLQHTCGSKIFSQKRCKQIVLFQSAVILCVLHAPKNSNIPSATGFFRKRDASRLCFFRAQSYFVYFMLRKIPIYPRRPVFFAKEMQAGCAFSERSRTLCTSSSEKVQDAPHIFCEKKETP